MRRFLLCCFGPAALFLLPLASSGQTATRDDATDWLDLAHGAVVLSQTSEYSDEWSALMLLDGTPDLGWCSDKGAPFPHEIVIEVGQSMAWQSLTFDNEHAEESTNPGISARQVEVWLSDEGPSEGFKKIADLELAQGAESKHKLPEDSRGRWLKLKVLNNWGHETYTEIMELSAQAKPLGQGEQAELAGVYNTNYYKMLFEQDGRQVVGCYDWDGGILSGTTDGRVVQFEWREDEGTQVGTAVMVLSADGSFLNGLWYEAGSYRGIWKGPRVTEGRPECTLRGDKTIETALEESGHAILYGLQFDTNSDRLRDDSEPTLQQVLSALNSIEGLALVVEGHTDSTGGADHNRDLAKRRAASVVRWLVDHGVAAERLNAQGFGADRPVADNKSAQGRALNRRVELRRQ